MNIELGCGTNKITTSTPDVALQNIHFTLDLIKSCLPDVVGNSTHLPYKTESVDAFISQHLIEHHDHKTFGRRTDDPEYGGDLLKHLKEVHRSLKPGGYYETMCPNFAYIAASYMQDPGNVLQLAQWATGGQRNKFDYHYVLLDFGLLCYFAKLAGFDKCELLHDFFFFGLHAKMTKG